LHVSKGFFVSVLLSLSVLILVSSPHVAATVSSATEGLYIAAIGNNQMPDYGATITLAPTSGPVGTFVAVTGIGFGDSGGCPISSTPEGLITSPICALDLGTEQMSGSFIVGNVHPGHYVVQAGYDGSAVAGFNVTSGSSSTSSSTVTSITSSSSISSASSSLESTSTTFTMTVTKTVQAVIPTSLSFGSVVGSSVVITVTLTGSSHGLVGPISGQTVSVSVSSNWSSSGSCITKANGACQVTLSKPPNGSYSVTVKFAGNSYFAASTATGTIVVK